MKILVCIAVFALGCGATQTASQEGGTESTTTSAPAGTDSAPAAPTAEASPTTSASAPGVNKCQEAKGKCTPMQAAIACKRMEKTPDWGCGENQFCCIQ